jgi:NAD(P)-dependent dehydrogenase (short-subunit alcohol dehydrogenase family)
VTPYRLKDKSVIITGAASGIGRATALLVEDSGAKVTVADTNSEGGERVVDEIVSAGGTAHFVHTDISNEDSVEELVARAVEKYGRLHGAFNNAAIAGRGGALHEWSAEEYDRLIGITLTGAFFCLKHEVKHMIEAGGGSIVVTSAGGAFRMVPEIGAYALAKGGVNGLVRQAAFDYGKYGIRVNSVVPGVTETPMLGAQPGQDTDALGVLQPLGRIGQPEEVTEGAAWLLSDNSVFVTGEFLNVDGGLTL